MANLPMGVRSDWRRVLHSFLAVVVISGALFSGYSFFSTVRALFARTSLPFISRATSPAAVRGRLPGQKLPDISQKGERINILLLGIDQREGESGPWRTDTMILVSIDPAARSAIMLSIGRDLWVSIPGFGESRINMAHHNGDLYNYPGGGVALAKKTVASALGVPVHYYVRINFTGFEKLVDTMGGLDIEVETPIHDEAYPDGHYGTIVVDIPAGMQHMDGKTALQYARSRHGTGDYDRMMRQQQVIVAARDKVVRLDIPLHRVPNLLELAGESLQTDLTIEEIVALAPIAKQIERSKIQLGIIDDSMTTAVTTPENWMVEVPDWDKIRELVDSLFPAPIPSVMPSPSLVQAKLASEGGRIELQNGTLVTDLAQKTAQRLRDKGYNVVSYEDADRFDHAQTVIIDYADKEYTVQTLAAQLNVKPENIRREGNPGSDIDISVILGRDYAQWRGSQ